MNAFRFTMPVQLFFGPNSSRWLEKALKPYDVIMVVMGPGGSARRSGALALVEERAKRLIIYDEARSNPTNRIADDGAELARREKVDCIVGIGGGSVIDSAKAIALAAHDGPPVWDFVVGRRRPKGALPLIAVNTTHGTGSEVDRYAVLTKEGTHDKMGFESPVMYPRASIDDPVFTVTLPKPLTASTAIDAFYHALEALLSKAVSPLSALISKEAIRLISKYLPLVYDRPDDLEGRYYLLYASMLAGIAIDMCRTGLIHALEHPVSGITDIHHGRGLALLGPAIIKFYEERIRGELEEALLPIMEVIGERNPGEALYSFQERFGLNGRLRDLGLKKEDLRPVVDMAFEQAPYLVSNSPVEPTKEQALNILESIY